MGPYRFSRLEEEVEDLIIVGGGIYGMMLALEAKKRGLNPLILERGRVGEATSCNSFQIIHGGLRYLQSLNFRRFLESKNEMSWFLKNLSRFCKTPPGTLPSLRSRPSQKIAGSIRL